MEKIEFSFPEDQEKLKAFIAENMNKNVGVSISGVDFFLEPDDGDDGFIWYTDPYGTDGGVSYHDAQNQPSSEILFNEIWRVAAYWNEDRDERGQIIQREPDPVFYEPSEEELAKQDMEILKFNEQCLSEAVRDLNACLNSPACVFKHWLRGYRTRLKQFVGRIKSPSSNH